MGGGGNTYDYGFRIYNPSLGKFLSVDPLCKSYPMLTPYQFGSNQVIESIDVDGLEALDYRLTLDPQTCKTKLIKTGVGPTNAPGFPAIGIKGPEIPKHYRIQYNGQTFVFYPEKPNPNTTSSWGVVDIKELPQLINDPEQFVKTHRSYEAAKAGFEEDMRELELTTGIVGSVIEGAGTGVGLKVGSMQVRTPRTMYHYTTESGEKGIVNQKN